MRPSVLTAVYILVWFPAGSNTGNDSRGYTCNGPDRSDATGLFNEIFAMVSHSGKVSFIYFGHVSSNVKSFPEIVISVANVCYQVFARKTSRTLLIQIRNLLHTGYGRS